MTGSVVNMLWDELHTPEIFVVMPSISWDGVTFGIDSILGLFRKFAPRHFTAIHCLFQRVACRIWVFRPAAGL